MEEVYFLQFILFGVLGWGIDSSYRSFIDKEWISGTYLLGFSFIYGIGGVFLVTMIPATQNYDMIMRFVIYASSLTLLELAGSLISRRVLTKPLWDYSENKFNFGGHIDLLHGFYWGLLGLLVEWIMVYELLVIVDLF